MKKGFVVFGLLASLITLPMFGCTDNMTSKKFGGTSKIELPVGKKLVNITWKGDSAWYLTRNMNSNDTPETYEFKEKSNFGMVEGTVIVIEKR